MTSDRITSAIVSNWSGGDSIYDIDGQLLNLYGGVTYALSL